MKTFAAIDVGSFELGMKIFEFSGRNSMREIDHIRHRIDLGSETYATGKLRYEKMQELCRVLREYTTIMKAYKVDSYRAYGTSAIREMKNMDIALGQIEQNTGIHMEVLSNSEQRFLDYKSIASKGELFNRIIEKGTAIVDIGGGSIQVSLFDKDTLVSTQNLRIGVLRLQERLGGLNAAPSQMENLVDEMAGAQLSVFKKLYLKDREIENIIVVDDYLSKWIAGYDPGHEQIGYVKREEYDRFMNRIREKSREECARALGVTEDEAALLFISSVLMNRIIKMLDARLIWAPGVTLCDGIAYEYAEQQKMVICEHDFEKDILACAKTMSKRYMGSRRRAETLINLALSIFDSMKKIHGLGRRERLYLQIAAILHDCGKYISLVNLGECSYHIIMSTEIIGLSHMEREIVAYIVKFNHDEFQYYEKLSAESSLDKNAYLIIAKLTAILKIANGLDRSHKQKFENVKIMLKDNELIFTVNTQEDITLEKGLFTYRAKFFEEVYNVRPVIKQRRTL
ncbi:MAG: HD domain-containing protein [Lachnospiraceae bacterium]|nr:HD domain-containing protein [Lachnospiraceae bacterium]